MYMQAAVTGANLAVTNTRYKLGFLSLTVQLSVVKITDTDNQTPERLHKILLLVPVILLTPTTNKNEFHMDHLYFLLCVYLPCRRDKLPIAVENGAIFRLHRYCDRCE
jgi:hypothetical protein